LECHADLASMASPAGLGTIHPSIAGAPTRPSMSYRFNAAESSVHSDTVMEKVSMASRRMAIHNFLLYRSRYFLFKVCLERFHVDVDLIEQCFGET
jgi:hypothetical protein